MNKRKLHHINNQLKPIRSWYLLIIALIFLLLGVWGLRQNNINALKLRDVVTKADEKGEDVEAPLRTLREYIYSHMNAKLSSEGTLQQPVQLKYRYERLSDKEKKRVEQVNAQIYTDAQTHCEKQFPKGLSGSGRIPCIKDYVTSKGVSEQPIPDALYKFDFISPLWSADFAGICLVFSTIFFVLFLLRFSLGKMINKNLENHL